MLFKLAQSGDLEAREKIVLQNTGLVYSVARRFLGRGYELEDLFQVGCIGLLKAIDRFDVNFDVKFSTYAVALIMGEIKRFLRDDGMIKISRSTKELAVKIYATRERLESENGREPTISEIEKEMGISSEEIAYAMNSVASTLSLSQPINNDGGEEILIMDRVSLQGIEDDIVDRMSLIEAMDKLTERERILIRLRFYENKNQTEVARILNTNQVQVSRMEKKIIEKLRELLA